VFRPRDQRIRSLRSIVQPMHQILHLIFEIGAFAVGYAYFQRLRAGQGDAIADEKRVWIIIGAAAGALLGSRILRRGVHAFNNLWFRFPRLPGPAYGNLLVFRRASR